MNLSTLFALFAHLLACILHDRFDRSNNFKCDQCDAGYVGYTRGHLFARIDGHRSKTSSVRKHYDYRHAGRIPGDLRNCFNVLKKCQNNFGCLINEMLLIT